MATTANRTRSSARKAVLSLGIVGAAAAVAGLGTFGTFTSTTTPVTEQVNSGTVSIVLGASGTAANRLSVTAANIVPGDTISRALTLTNNGDQSLATVSLTTTATVSSLLDTDAVNGLQLSIRTCTVPYTEAGVAPAYTYTCSGTETTVLTPRAVTGANVALTNPRALTPGQSDNFVVVLSLPQTADNTFQTKTSTISFSFTGTQRVGTNR